MEITHFKQAVEWLNRKIIITVVNLFEWEKGSEIEVEERKRR